MRTQLTSRQRALERPQHTHHDLVKPGEHSRACRHGQDLRIDGFLSYRSGGLWVEMPSGLLREKTFWTPEAGIFCSGPRMGQSQSHLEGSLLFPFSLLSFQECTIEVFSLHKKR